MEGAKFGKVDGQRLFEPRRVIVDWLSEGSLFHNPKEPHQARMAARVQKASV